MGNVCLKVLEKSLNFLFKKGYVPCELPEVCLKFPLNMIGQFYDGFFKGHPRRILKSWYRAGGQNKDYAAGSHTN